MLKLSTCQDRVIAKSLYRRIIALTNKRTQGMVAHSYHSKFAKDFAKKPSKINRYFNENVKQKISNT